MHLTYIYISSLSLPPLCITNTNIYIHIHIYSYIYSCICITPTVDDDEEKEIYLPFYIQIPKYMLQILNIIDLIAIVPYYVQVGETQTKAGGQFVRVLRLIRIFRIFKIGKNSKGIAMLMSTMKQSVGALSIVGFFVTLGIIFFGSIQYFFEGGTYDVQLDSSGTPVAGYYRITQSGSNGPPVGPAYELSPFVDIPASMYWAVVTSTTVGYGDLFPTSVGGRIVAVFCMYYGVLLMALPITVIGNNFTKEYDRIHGNNEEELVYNALMQLAYLTHEESLVALVGGHPVNSEWFKFTRLIQLIGTLDNTKRDALKQIISRKFRKKMMQAAKAPKTKKLLPEESAKMLEATLVDVIESIGEMGSVYGDAWDKDVNDHDDDVNGVVGGGGGSPPPLRQPNLSLKGTGGLSSSSSATKKSSGVAGVKGTHGESPLNEEGDASDQADNWKWAL